MFWKQVESGFLGSDALEKDVKMFQKIKFVWNFSQSI